MKATGTTLSAFSVAALLLFLNASPSIAQDAPPAPTATPDATLPAAAPKPATVPDPRLDPPRIAFKGDPVEMSLAQVVLTAFQQNLDIEIARLDTGIASDRYQGEQGIYDPTLISRIGRRQVEGESNSAPVGAGLSRDGAANFDQDSDEMAAELSQLAPTGATIALGVERNRTNFEDYRSGLVPVDPQEAQRAYVRVTQPLLKNFGPKVTNLGIRTARLEEQIQRNLYRQEVEDRVADVMVAYWDVVFAVRNLEVQQASLEAALELERVNEVRVRTGSAPRSDLYQAQAEVAQRRNNVIVAKSEILAAQDELLRILNWSDPAETWSRPIIPTDKPTAYDLNLTHDEALVIAEAYKGRFDLDAVRLANEQAVLTKDALWWQRFPELNALADLGYSGFSEHTDDSFEEVTDREYEDYFVGLEFRYPLLNRKPRADYRESLKQVEKSGRVQENLELRIATEVRRSTRAIRAAQESIEASEAQVRAAQETLDSERKRLDVGSSTTFNVLQFQEDLAQAQVNQVFAQVTYQKGVIELERSRGSLVDSIGSQLGIQFDFAENTLPDPPEAGSE